MCALEAAMAVRQVYIHKYIHIYISTQALKDNMRRWRSKRHRSTTTFHPDASSIMHDLLPLLEEWKRTGGTSGTVLDQEEGAGTGAGRRGRRPSVDTGPLYTQGEVGGAVQVLQGMARDRMKTILRTRSLRGCPLNMPFTDVEELLAKVRFSTNKCMLGYTLFKRSGNKLIIIIIIVIVIIIIIIIIIVIIRIIT
jgi:hypothetical protein